MKKTLLTFVALAVALGAVAGSRMATEEWVRRYVSDALAGYSGGTPSRSENGTNYYTRDGVTIAIEDCTEYAFVVSEDTAHSRSNGIVRDMVFVPIDLTNAVHGAHSIHLATNGMELVAGSGVTASTKYRRAMETWLYDYATSNWFCRIAGTFIQPSYAALVLAGEE